MSQNCVTDFFEEKTLIFCVYLNRYLQGKNQPTATLDPPPPRSTSFSQLRKKVRAVSHTYSRAPPSLDPPPQQGWIQAWSTGRLRRCRTVLRAAGWQIYPATSRSLCTLRYSLCGSGQRAVRSGAVGPFCARPAGFRPELQRADVATVGVTVGPR